MTPQELIVVGKRIEEWTNPRCWAWRDGYRLPLTQGLICPEFG